MTSESKKSVASAMLLILSKMSDDTIDKNITPRLAKLAENPDPYELKKIIDECAYSSLTTDTMMIMHSIWEILMKECYP